ncbi:MAG: sodium:alanine symporter family protein, partial [Oscillospiraceae bacterium]|nr:sodium:alanine symporter family protein [Oscillospiraceae bacterium]
MRWDVAEAALGAVMAVLLLAVGGYLTWKLRAVQLRRFCCAFDSVRGERGHGISAFSAACTNLGATVGVGNVFGVAAGIAVGGPGTLLWMLIAAFFGM